MSQSKNIVLGLAILGSTVWATSCDPLSGMIKLAKDSDLKADPNPLELHGTTVPFTMTAKLPTSMMKKNTEYTMEVYYRAGDIDAQADGTEDSKELKIGAVTFDGDKYAGTKDQPSESKQFSFQYKDEFERGGLWFKGVGKNKKNGKTKSFPSEDGKQAIRIPAPNTVRGIVTSALHVKDPSKNPYDGTGESPFAFFDHGYVEESSSTPVRLDYEKGVAQAKKSFMENEKTMEVIDLFLKPGNIPPFSATGTSSHSPEGSETVNTNLAQNRAKNMVDSFVEKLRLYNYKKEDLSKYVAGFKIDPKSLDATWPEFKTMVNKNGTLTADQKQEIISIVDGDGNFVEKERQLSQKDYYSVLENEVYPYMRYARVDVSMTKGTRSLEELAPLAAAIVKGEKEAEQMSEAEFLFVAENTADREQRAAILEAGAKKYPSHKVYNNLGATYLEHAAITGNTGSVDKAENALKQAAGKKETAETHYNLANVYFMKGDVAKAKEHLDKAVKMGGSGSLAKKLKGAEAYFAIKAASMRDDNKYNEAIASLNQADKNYVNNFNSGLAKLLQHKDFAGAANDFNAASKQYDKDGEVYYMLAIVALKENKLEDMGKFLGMAIAKDSMWKDKAVKDPVFYSVRTGSAFTNAVK
ncbi:tetratricopeptide repeat protein [Eisenibacter elegans]|uniref:tetratricopeptide repeat protein n=1 Tax=Eisenibacter elegans TaxID=997 RepID=UPI000479F021|nr:tetratricopeptide repeat protein [Eisenibacter elegans]